MGKSIYKANVTHYFSVSMNYAQCEDLYRQHIKFIVVTSNEGKRIQLPKVNLQKFVSPTGLSGKFKLLIDGNNKIISIDDISNL